MRRYAIIGPTYPFRGGIAHHTTLLTQHLRQEHEVLLISFTQQYPAWLFPGKSDRDPTKKPLQTDAEYLLNPLNPRSWRRALHRLRLWGPDMVVMPWWHPFFSPIWITLTRGIKKLPGPPQLIFICHNVMPHEQGRLGRWLLPAVIRITLRGGDRFIVHSHADGHILQQLLPGANIHITPHPSYAALGQAAVATPVALPEQLPLLLFCGFVRPYKGLDILLEALALVTTRRPVHLLIAGEFWQGGEAAYRQQITRLNLADAVTIINQYLPDEQLAACIERADLVVLPYRSATQSGVIQVAFGRETPVVTTAVGGLAEVVSDGRTGFVVPPEDPAALAAAIEKYFAEEKKEIFQKNIRAANDRFSWSHFIEQLSGEQEV